MCIPALNSSPTGISTPFSMCVQLFMHIYFADQRGLEATTSSLRCRLSGQAHGALSLLNLRLEFYLTTERRHLFSPHFWVILFSCPTSPLPSKPCQDGLGTGPGHLREPGRVMRAERSARVTSCHRHLPTPAQTEPGLLRVCQSRDKPLTFIAQCLGKLLFSLSSLDRKQNN